MADRLDLWACCFTIWAFCVAHYRVDSIQLFESDIEVLRSATILIGLGQVSDDWGFEASYLPTCLEPPVQAVMWTPEKVATLGNGASTV